MSRRLPAYNPDYLWAPVQGIATYSTSRAISSSNMPEPDSSPNPHQALSRASSFSSTSQMDGIDKKPISTTSERRKEQNRIAQRRHRSKRVNRIKVLEEKVMLLERSQQQLSDSDEASSSRGKLFMKNSGSSSRASQKARDFDLIEEKSLSEFNDFSMLSRSFDSGLSQPSICQTSIVVGGLLGELEPSIMPIFYPVLVPRSSKDRLIGVGDY